MFKNSVKTMRLAKIFGWRDWKKRVPRNQMVEMKQRLLVKQVQGNTFFPLSSKVFFRIFSEKLQKCSLLVATTRSS